MKGQINIRVSDTIREMIEMLAEPYGSITAVIEVAVSLLYTDYVNRHATDDLEKDK